MKKILSLIIASLIFSANYAKADPLLNYSYLEASYQWNELSGTKVESANGYAARGSYSPVDYLFLDASYEFYANKVNGINLNENLYKFGLGVWEPVADDLDLVGRAGGIFSDPGGDTGGDSDSGAYGGVELRGKLNDKFELDGYAIYSSDIEVNPNIDVTNWLFGSNLIMRTGNHGALRFGAGINEESNVTLSLGLRVTL